MRPSSPDYKLQIDIPNLGETNQYPIEGGRLAPSTSTALSDGRTDIVHYADNSFEQMQALWKEIHELGTSQKDDMHNALHSRHDKLIKCADLGHWEARSIIANEIADSELRNPMGANFTTSIVWFKKALAACEQRLNTQGIAQDDYSDNSDCQEMYRDLLELKDIELDALLMVSPRSAELPPRSSTPVWEPNAKEIENLEHTLRDDKSPALDRLKAGRTLADNFFERGLHKKAVSYYKETLAAMPTESFPWEQTSNK